MECNSLRWSMQGPEDGSLAQPRAALTNPWKVAEVRQAYQAVLGNCSRAWVSLPRSLFFSLQ